MNIKKYKKNLFYIFILFFSTIPNLISNWKSVIELFSKDESKNTFEKISIVIGSIFSDKFFYIILLSLILIFAIYLTIKNYLKTKEIRGVRVRLSNIIRRYNFHMILKIHSFHHVFTDVVDEIKDLGQGKPELLNTYGKKHLQKLLIEIQDAIQSGIGEYVSINVKLFTHTNGDDIKSKSQITSTELITFERRPSFLEIEKSRHNELERRKDEEIFKICQNFYSCHKKLSDWITELKETYTKKFSINPENKDDLKNNLFRLNSAFNYVLGSNSHYFISNDIEKDTENGYFFSNSNNYDKYYKSLAVFLINKPTNSGSDIVLNQPFGMLIIDCNKKHVFEELFISQLVGYYAHRLHEYFELFKKNI